jgi:CRP/FNR family transcriptional regulator, cyclic AMP receptor protein
MPADLTLLSEIPLFSSLDEDEKKLLGEVVDTRTLKAGETLFRHGDPGHAMYVVSKGKLEIFIKDHAGQKIVLAETGPGDVFGELALLDEGPRSATAVATEDSELIELDRGDLLLLVTKRPESALHMLGAMGAMTRKADMLLRTRVARNANEEIESEADRGGVVLRVADAVANFSGSISFLVLHVGIFALWIGINLALGEASAFDPFPFGLLTMVVSLEAIILSTLLLFSSNRQTARDRIRSDIEYQVNLKAELEVAHLHEKIDEMREDVLARLQRMERALGGAPGGVSAAAAKPAS